MASLASIISLIVLLATYGYSLPIEDQFTTVGTTDRINARFMNDEESSSVPTIEVPRGFGGQDFSEYTTPAQSESHEHGARGLPINADGLFTSSPFTYTSETPSSDLSTRGLYQNNLLNATNFRTFTSTEGTRFELIVNKTKPQTDRRGDDSFVVKVSVLDKPTSAEVFSTTPDSDNVYGSSTSGDLSRKSTGLRANGRPQETSTRIQKRPTTESPEETSTRIEEPTTTESPEGTSTRIEELSTTESPEETSTRMEEPTTTESPEETSTRMEELSTTESPKETSTRMEESPTTESPEETSTTMQKRPTVKSPKDKGSAKKPNLSGTSITKDQKTDITVRYPNKVIQTHTITKSKTETALKKHSDEKETETDSKTDLFLDEKPDIEKTDIENEHQFEKLL